MFADSFRSRWLKKPAYTFPNNREDLAILRAVCKEGFTREMADILHKDMRAAVDHFASRPNHTPNETSSTFHH